MATSASVPPTTQLCDYCHQKPKFSNHSYCSKTCAGQAATLCNHCHKKPKFQNFEYCGKNCAALANPGGKTTRSGGPGPASQPPVSGKTAAYSKGSYNPNVNTTTQQQSQPQVAPATFDPVQLAKLVAQHIPQVQALLAPNSGHAAPSAFAGASAQAAPPNVNPVAQNNNPFLGGIPATQQAIAGGSTNTGMHSYGGISSNSLNPAPNMQHKLHAVSTQQAADNLECLIPGCGKPVHIDAKGVKTSDYCSMRHREEAVTSGLVSPCIMCLVMPQNDADYFCSRACREESMNKQLDYYEDDEGTLVSE